MSLVHPRILLKVHYVSIYVARGGGYFTFSNMYIVHRARIAHGDPARPIVLTKGS